MILAAKSAGADTFKIQLYDPRTVFGDSPREPGKFSQKEWDAIYAARLGRRQVFWIKEECEGAGLRFLSSVSDLERLQWLEDVGVERYKIASDDAMNKELCSAIIGKGKTTLISDGYIEDDCVLWFHNNHWDFNLLRTKQVRFLYCISNYPVAPNEIEFPKFGGIYAGFSDHTIGITAAVVAMSLGAKIIEKHFTLDKTLPGPDHVCSAGPNELEQLCRMRDDVERILYK